MLPDANGGSRELAAYSRLIEGNAAAWLTALRYFGDCPSLDLSVARPRQVVGSLSALAVDAGQVGHITSRQAFRLAGVKSDRFSLLMVRSGELEICTSDCLRAQAGDLVVLGPGLPITMTAAAAVDAMLVQWPATASRLPAAGHYQTCWAGPLLAGYLARSRYFRNHRHAVHVTEQFLLRLHQGLAQPEAQVRPMPPVLDDARVLRAVRFLHSHPRWRFDLPTLARVAAASERNLYYLMKAQTGMTPYRFYQRCRLLRLREALLCCHCEQPSIAWHAMDEGFSHLGRFAALYREHFGELPRDTLVWRSRLRAQTQQLEPGSVAALSAA